MFRRLAEGVFASPQISLADVAEAQRLGVRLIINNRPEDEAPPSEQTPGDEIAAAAAAAGIAYCAIPVTHAGFSEPQVAAMVEALAPSRTTAEWVKLLDEGQIPNAPVSRPADLFDDPHLVWRQLFRKYPHPSEGEIMMVEPPMRMTATPPASFARRSCNFSRS
jgi:protein tyrosine phosphatase (PTP) superfamily phosphohydrolase (DUF442 family)